MITATLLSMCLNGAMAHEGFSARAHRDSHGTLAIGYGYNLTYNQLNLDRKTISNFKRNGISKARARQLATQVCLQVKNGLEAKFEWFKDMNTARASVMMDMGYNLGVGGLDNFNKTLRYLSKGRYAMASNEMLNSRWSRQVKGRAKELAQIMRVG